MIRCGCDAIAILALLSSCCQVAHLESEQLSKMLWWGSLEVSRSKVMFVFDLSVVVCSCSAAAVVGDDMSLRAILAAACCSHKLS